MWKMKQLAMRKSEMIQNCSINKPQSGGDFPAAPR